ncbi:hypothetical protein QE438_000621 [Pseudoxanthomonas sp. SORGH_AS 997]|uniref:Uncharacterized protein n=1 Tax=Pseudoxanthomonas winnipegensis TaxID=2480810 RepID=A0AAW8GAM5_9GAMM|nr:hypothetical protein [Pseudoxanthomonas winnipegensis]MDQ1132675.1 hypothetical protein [Pseudoxanthomonas winnipegensis]MDR6137317.1 hypothetical protein [Pseudoxanthomonas sp. SORGH_AS_0997]
MDDGPAAARGAQDIVAVHRVAALPGDAIALLGHRVQAALEGPDAPARIAQLASDFAADAAAGAQDQRSFVRRDIHGAASFLSMGGRQRRPDPDGCELPIAIDPLYIFVWPTRSDGSTTAVCCPC